MGERDSFRNHQELVEVPYWTRGFLCSNPHDSFCAPGTSFRRSFMGTISGLPSSEKIRMKPRNQGCCQSGKGKQWRNRREPSKICDSKNRITPLATGVQNRRSFHHPFPQSNLLHISTIPSTETQSPLFWRKKYLPSLFSARCWGSDASSQRQ